MCQAYFINFCFSVFAPLNCLTNQVFQKQMKFSAGQLCICLIRLALQADVVFVLQAESRSLTFVTVFTHIETPRNCEECMEIWLSTQTNPVGTIQSKAPSQISFPVVIELSHLCNGHTLLTQYSGAKENIEMSRSFFREGNF